MKKLLALGLAATVAVAGLGALAGCGGRAGDSIKVGFIALHDDNSTYDKNSLTRSVRRAKTRTFPMKI